MKIISNFRDYYDSIAKKAQDQATIFLRKSEKNEHGAPFADPVSLHDAPSGQWSSRYGTDMDSVVVCFCGKFYPVVVRTERDGPTGLSVPRTIKRFIYSAGALAPYLNRGMASIVHRYYAYWNKPNDSLARLIESHGPIFALTPGWMVHRNPRLSDYKFESIIPPLQAYQELYRTVINTARPDKPIPEMSNDIKIHQAGFNLKTSFRSAKRSG